MADRANQDSYRLKSLTRRQIGFPLQRCRTKIRHHSALPALGIYDNDTEIKDMTCVIGLIHRKRIYMGADSAAVGNRFIRATSLPKVFRKGPFLIGYCGSFRMGQVLQHCLDIPEQEKDEPTESYLVARVVEVARLALKSKGVSSVEQNKEKGGQFLIGYRGQLYSVNNDFHVGNMLDGFDCIGSGAVVALGAMKALEDLQPKMRLERSLEISSYYVADVRPPFHIQTLSPGS